MKNVKTMVKINVGDGETISAGKRRLKQVMMAYITHVMQTEFDIDIESYYDIDVYRCAVERGLESMFEEFDCNMERFLSIRYAKFLNNLMDMARGGYYSTEAMAYVPTEIIDFRKFTKNNINNTMSGFRKCNDVYEQMDKEWAENFYLYRVEKRTELITKRKAKYGKRR